MPRLNDDDTMPFGTWEGTKLGEVPDSYWRWFREQEWAPHWPDLLDYAEVVDGPAALRGDDDE